MKHFRTISRRSVGIRSKCACTPRTPPRTGKPQSGTVHHIELPGDPQEFSVLREQGVRLDSGVVDGSVVGVHYDPMLAKVISYAPTRTAAARLLASTLARTRIHGLRTNRDLLVNVLAHPAFIAGDTDTAFFETHDLEKLSTPLADTDAERLSALAAALADAAHNRASARVIGRLPSGVAQPPVAAAEQELFHCVGRLRRPLLPEPKRRAECTRLRRRAPGIGNCDPGSARAERSTALVRRCGLRE